MRESPLYQSILEEGRQEGLQEGLQEGELRRQRSAILQVLRARFGARAASRFTSALDGLDSLAELEPLLDLAATCSSPDEFRRGLPRQEATQ